MRRISRKIPAVETVTDHKDTRHSLEKARKILEQGEATTLQDTVDILNKRARALARVPDEQTAATAMLEVVEFVLGSGKYAIEVAHVREVGPLKELTSLPSTPSFVLGIVHLHGRVLSVIDIGNFLALPRRGLSDLDKLIVICNNELEFGVLADDILGVRVMPLADIQLMLPTLSGAQQEYIKGITLEGEVVLDAEKLLSDKKIVVHQDTKP